MDMTLILIFAFFLYTGVVVFLSMRFSRNVMVWILRMHFYRQGLNHKAVDREVLAIFATGFDWRDVRRTKKMRAAAGLLPLSFFSRLPGDLR
jgi:hypothetical protein